MELMRWSSFAFCALGAASADWSTCNATSCQSAADNAILLQHRLRAVGIFADVTAQILPAEMFAEWHHADLTNPFSSPIITDVNGDGVLDVFSANHCLRPGGWDFGLGTLKGSSVSFSQSISSLVTWTDPDKANGRRCTVDAHGGAIHDLDGDGLLDLFVTIGASRGQAVDETSDSALLWGDGTATSPHFSGARSAARTAGVNNFGGRTRFVYLADVNGDGLLDVFIGNVLRADTLNIPSELLINQGDRKFKTESSLQEYTLATIVHDVNKDHVADEVVVTRDRCLMDGRQNEEFCSQKPKGSIAVYKWSPSQGQMVEYPQTSPNSWSTAYTVQSGDFDQDGYADLLVPRGTHLWAYYSRDRASGFDLGTPVQQHMGGKMKSVKVADFDLDGFDDLLVIYKDNSYKMFEYQRNGDDGQDKWISKAVAVDLGDLGAPVEHMCVDQNGEPRSDLSSDKLWACANGHQYAKPVETKGVTIADFNNDGYPDVVIANNRGPTVYYMNKMSGNRFLQVRLVGSTRNARGLGATVLLAARLGGYGTELTTQLREISHGGNDGDALGSRDDRIIFGLGQEGVPEKLTVYWPSPSRAESVLLGHQLGAWVTTSLGEVLVVQESAVGPITTSTTTSQIVEDPVTTTASEIVTSTIQTACAEWCADYPLTVGRCERFQTQCSGCFECMEGPTNTTATTTTTKSPVSGRCDTWCPDYELTEARCTRFATQCGGCMECF